MGLNRSNSAQAAVNLVQQQQGGALKQLHWCSGSAMHMQQQPQQQQVRFVTVAYSDMSLMQLMSQGLHALPVLQVNARGRKYRYSGKHLLGPMLHFVSKALVGGLLQQLGQEPLASLEVAQLCSSGAQQQQQLLPSTGGTSSSCSAAAAGDGSGSAGVCAAADAGVGAGAAREQQQVACCGAWSCPRWDGEATVEELERQQHAAFFWLSVVFLEQQQQLMPTLMQEQQQQLMPTLMQEQQQQLHAAAAKIEVDVPDFLMEHTPLNAVLHSPVLAVGAAVLALLLFPKLIRVTINYLFYPGIAALLAYLAISHPEQTANSIYVLLEAPGSTPPLQRSWSSFGARGTVRGCDGGVGSGHAAQAGLVQLPQPQLPQLPGQRVVAKQFGKARVALKQRVLDLDGDDDDEVSDRGSKPLLPAALADGRPPWQQQQQQQQRGVGGNRSGGRQQSQHTEADDDIANDQGNSSNSKLLRSAGAPQQQQQQQQQAPAPAVADVGGSPAEEQPATAQAALQALQGFGKRAAAAGKRVAELAQDALPEHQEVQAGLQAARKGLGSAAQQLESRVQELGGMVQQEGLGDRVQGLRERAGAAAGVVVEAAKGLRDKAGSLAAGQAIVQQQRAQGPAVLADRNGSDEGQHSNTEEAAVAIASASRVDSILANS
ncbi:hypothetical protein COO60DRAFT_1703429 [Scenedesmus sp. NREL 46B-D3]|nr:hypothetical protein COO60DRAFT_1703429 [Scenedesmus sp. NREL 46B-D3]